MDSNIAIGTKIFTRIDRLRGLLESVPEWVSTVYVADDGGVSQDKRELYDGEYGYELETIEMDYDEGVGAGRNTIVDAVSEEFLIIVDTDHRIPNTALALCEQLRDRPDLGGIGGALVEPDNGQLYCEAQDFREETLEEGTKLVRGPYIGDEPKEINIVSGLPLVAFDFIPNAAMFRTECLVDQAWDPHYVIEFEHVDFYVSHWKRTDWSFAVSPSVQFPHYPGGDTEYLINRFSNDKERDSREYFLNKWDYIDDDVRGWMWFRGGEGDDTDFDTLDRATAIFREEGIGALWARTRKFLKDKYMG